MRRGETRAYSGQSLCLSEEHETHLLTARAWSWSDGRVWCAVDHVGFQSTINARAEAMRKLGQELIAAADAAEAAHTEELKRDEETKRIERDQAVQA